MIYVCQAYTFTNFRPTPMFSEVAGVFHLDSDYRSIYQTLQEVFEKNNIGWQMMNSVAEAVFFQHNYQSLLIIRKSVE